MSTPISSLKDPSSFGPPPKNVNYYGASSTGGSGLSQGASSSTGDDKSYTPSAVDHSQLNKHADESNEVPKYSQGPYRVDTTGLSTSNLPKPPVRRLDQAVSSSPANTATTRQTPVTAMKPKPSLPPRLPPREAATSSQDSVMKTPQSPPPPYSKATGTQNKAVSNQEQDTPLLNQSAIDRLSAKGISVPGLGIGGQPTSGKVSEHTQASSASANVSELQARLAKANASISPKILGPETSDAGKKLPLPPKKPGIGIATRSVVRSEAEHQTLVSPSAPPVPLNTKPR